MASKEQSVTLLRKNKRAQVDALNALGFSLDYDVRASLFASYLKWGSGLLDVTVAANRKSDNRKFYFTLDEWQSLSASEQSLFLLRGVRVRACGQSFIIAPDTIKNKAWGTAISTPDLHAFSSLGDAYRFYDAYNESRLVALYFEEVSGGAPAVESALAYKAFTESRDGLDDTSEWCLPTLAHLFIMWRWRPEINAVFSAVWSTDFIIAMVKYWSCCKYSNGNIYCIRFDEGGRSTVEDETTVGAVRPICLD